MRTAWIFGLLAWSVAAAPATGPVVVSSNHRFLQFKDGTPFFWLADTGWLLFGQLDRPETLRYLDDRQHKGFNVIQVMLLHSPQMKTAGGARALVGGDPAKPDTTPEGYWDHVDWVLGRAAERGIWLGLVPAWGSVVKQGRLNNDNVVAYATFLARRYRDKPNVFWIVGGDIPGDDHIDVWRLLGKTLKAEDPGHLITYHPIGRTQSSTWFHDEPWLDLNMFQSGHQRYDQDTKSPRRYGEDNWRYVLDDYVRQPAKPVVDGEPSYENIPQGLHDGTQPRWIAADCRRYAYWSVFAGAFGHTYGDNSIMQFYKQGGGRGSFTPINTWVDALDDPGSGQMQFLKSLMLSRPYFERVPDQNALAGENGARYDYVAVTRGTTYLFAYTYTGRPFRLRLGILSGGKVHAVWYAPRDGSERAIGEFANEGTREFTPPGKPEPGNDWVLILDSVK